MQSRQGMAIGLIMCFAVWSVACQAVAGDTPSVSPSPAVTETSIAMNTEIPTETITPTLTNILPTTEIPIVASPSPLAPLEEFPYAESGRIPLANFFLNGFTDECTPSCWYDLKIGQSKAEDIQHFFDTILGFNGTIDFWFPHSGATINLSGTIYPVDGYTSTGYQWATIDNLGIATYLDDEAGNLQGIAIVWGNNTDEVIEFHLSDLFQQLGTPSHIITSPQSLQLFIIYDVGLVFFLGGFGSEFCIGDTEIAKRFPFGTIMVTLPLTSRLNDLTKLEMRFFGNHMDSPSLEPVESVTNTTPADIVQSVLAGNQTCLEFETD